MVEDIARRFCFKQNAPTTRNRTRGGLGHEIIDSPHETRKHVVVDCHFIRRKIRRKDVKLGRINIEDQITNFLTKAITTWNLSDDPYKLKIVNINAPS